MHEPIWDDLRRFEEVWRRVEHAHRPPPPPPPRPIPPPPPGPFPPPPPPPRPCRRSVRFNPQGYRR